LVPDEIQPISDVRAGKEYRMHMAKVMLERGLKAAVARMDGDAGNSEAPAYGESLI
jgi:xanthine dehydrogenase iron-sulfur cluster and FAD-binding subunit A